MSVGIRAFSLGPAHRGRLRSSTALYGIPFTIIQPCVAATSTYTIFSSDAPKRFRVFDVTGVMTGAGGALDTVVVNNGSNAITNTIDVSALADQDTFVAAKINDTNWQVNKNGSLSVVTVSGALCTIYINCVWIE